MSRIKCPSCKTVFTADTPPGTTFACPECTLQIKMPSLARVAAADSSLPSEKIPQVTLPQVKVPDVVPVESISSSETASHLAAATATSLPPEQASSGGTSNTAPKSKFPTDIAGWTRIGAYISIPVLLLAVAWYLLGNRTSSRPPDRDANVGLSDDEDKSKVGTGPTITEPPTATKLPEKVKSLPDKAANIAEGFGSTPDESLKDAFRNAVRQVVGAVVDAETLLKNDQIVSDNVLTYSDGFVTSYEEISRTTDKGIFRTKIKAAVERRSVVAKLKSANVATKDIDGKGLFAGVVTQIEAEKNAVKLLERALDGFPANVLTAEVVGKPTVLKRTDTSATIELTVAFSVNKKAYEPFCDNLSRVLEAICKSKADFAMKFGTPNPRAGTSAPPAIRFAPMPASKADEKTLREWKYKPKLPTVFLCRKYEEDRTDWTYYYLDSECRPALEGCMRLPMVSLSLIGSNDAVIHTDLFVAQATSLDIRKGGYGERSQTAIRPIFRNRMLLQYYAQARWLKGDSMLFWISPSFFSTRTSTLEPEFISITSVTVRRQFTLSLDELKAVKSVKCDIGQ